MICKNALKICKQLTGLQIPALQEGFQGIWSFVCAICFSNSVVVQVWLQSYVRTYICSHARLAHSDAAKGICAERRDIICIFSTFCGSANFAALVF